MSLPWWLSAWREDEPFLRGVGKCPSTGTLTPGNVTCGATAVGTVSAVGTASCLSPHSSSPLPAAAWTGGAQPPDPSGLGGSAVGKPCPAPGGQLRAWHGRSDALAAPRRALGASLHPIGNRYPRPTQRTLPEVTGHPPRDPRGWQGQDSSRSPLPPRPPSSGARIRGGRGEGQGWRQRLEPPTPTPGRCGEHPQPQPARSAQSTAPLPQPGTPGTQSGHRHKSCTGRSLGDAGGERSFQPHATGTGGAGARPWGQDGPRPGQPRELWCVTPCT